MLRRIRWASMRSKTYQSEFASVLSNPLTLFNISEGEGEGEHNAKVFKIVIFIFARRAVFTWDTNLAFEQGKTPHISRWCV